MFRQLIRRLHNKVAPSNRIVLSQDEKCFIAYHPRSDHPYEFTRPLPKQEKHRDESLLKVSSRNMITKAPNLEQVQDLTYTHKSYWREDRGPKLRKKYKDYFNDNVDRKGLTS